MDDVVQQRQQRLVACLAQHQCIGQVVDVLRRAGEMNEFTYRLQFRVAGDLFLEEILDRLDVVVGGALDILDPLGVLLTELVDDVVQHALRMRTQWRHLGDPVVLCQRLQPAHLDDNPVAYQAVLTENRAQRFRPGTVTTIDGGDGGKL